jgi:hypothetical protein
VRGIAGGIKDYPVRRRGRKDERHGRQDSLMNRSPQKHSPRASQPHCVVKPDSC